MRASKLINRILVSGAAFLTCGFAHATVLTLPAANEMSAGVYNSFNVYSLDLLELCASDPRCQPSSPLPVKSGDGQIADQAIILAGASGNNVDNFKNPSGPFTPGSQVDNSFLTPNGQQANSYTMVDPGNQFVGDQTNRWDISVSLLKNYLNGHDLVFLFDNNQQGSYDGQNIAIWGQARIVNSAGTLIDNLCFEISTGTGGCADQGNNPTPDSSKYLPIIGNFCVDKDSGASYAPVKGNGNSLSCPVAAGHPNGGYLVTNNLATATAEFAAFNQILDDAVQNAAYGDYFLSINVKYIGNLAGAEQLWLCSECDISTRRQVPEPGSLVLAALGLMGLVAFRRRESRRDVQ